MKYILDIPDEIGTCEAAVVSGSEGLSFVNLKILKEQQIIEKRTGRWIWDDEGYHCTECFYHAYGNTSEVMLGDFKFCPNCGAKMEVQG